MTENLNIIVDWVLESIDGLPDPPRESIRNEFTKLKEMIMDNRPPRILILGRRGAGKSSLINAIFNQKVAKVGSVVSETGKPKWHDLNNEKGSIRILDTRGLGDRTKPESAKFEDSMDEIKSKIMSECPDAVLFLCKATDVDSRITEDIENLIEIRKFISTSHVYDIPVAALVTQVDQLDPADCTDPPYEDHVKQDNIQLAVSTLKNALDKSNIASLRVIPLSAYAKWDRNGVISYNRYWNVDLLIEYLMEVLPNSAQLQLARLSSLRKSQCKFARVLVGSTATVCAGIAATPLTAIIDIIPITSAQIGMMTGIAYIAGRELSKESANEFLVALGVNVGAGFALREGARALIKFVFPGVGNAISATVAFAGTWAIGEAAIAYFIDENDIEEVKLRFKKAKKEHKENS